MQKNVSGQKIRVFAFASATNLPVTGDAANITCEVSKDFASGVALTDTNPTEISGGYYDFDVTQAESNYDNLRVIAASSTSGVVVIGCPADIVLVPENFADTPLATASELAKVPKSDGTATWNATALASIESEATDALNAYDPPTKAEMDLRTLPTADYFDPATDAVANVTTVGSVSGNVDGSVGSVTGGINTAAGTITTLDALDTAQDSQHGTTRTTILAKVLKYVQLLFRSDAAIETDNATELTEINADGGSGAGDASSQADSLEALRDRGDASWTTATGFAVAGDEMNLADDAITAGKFDESTAFPLKSADAGDTEVARTGADGDTLETLSDQLDSTSGLPVIASGTIGDTGNDTTHLHLTGLTFADDTLNDLLIVLYDDSGSLYYSNWVSDWVLSTELATLANTLPITPEDSTDTYVVYAIRKDVTSSGGGANLTASMTVVQSCS